MKILVACEESQAICKEFRKLWHEAYSCDIQECSGWNPEWHIRWDALVEAYSGKYDMMIAHPPCTYLSNAWAIHLFPKKVLNQERYKKWLEWKDFFMKLLNAPIKYIAVENPIQSKIFEIPKYSQIIQPYQFWHPVSKKTCLWLKNLPELKPTNIVEVEVLWYFKTGSKKWKPIDWVSYNHWSKDRSKTFPGIAKAMAEQWWNL